MKTPATLIKHCLQTCIILKTIEASAVIHNSSGTYAFGGTIKTSGSGFVVTYFFMSISSSSKSAEICIFGQTVTSLNVNDY